MKNEHKEHSPYITNRFKLWVSSTVFILILIRFYSDAKQWQFPLIPDEIILSVTLILIGYLWVQELRDRNRLQLLNSELVDAQSRLEREEIDIITTLILGEEAREPYVQGHSKRMTEISLVIARKMGFPDKRQKIIERACLLHDIGKIGIMDSILKKPAKLNDEEWKIMKSHPKKGADILKPLAFLNTERDIICHHHERYDGKGYPDGLKGEEIPLEARIIAVCDTFDAMNSDRAYRKALPHDAIITELKEVSGTQLDPAVVDVFLGLLKANPSFWKTD